MKGYIILLCLRKKKGIGGPRPDYGARESCLGGGCLLVTRRENTRREKRGGLTDTMLEWENEFLN
jgi:hypothetical protein